MLLCVHRLVGEEKGGLPVLFGQLRSSRVVARLGCLLERVLHSKQVGVFA